MAVRQCSTATWVARCTSDKMSRKSLARSPCVWVFWWEVEHRDIFRSVASCSASRYKGAPDALSELGML